MYTTKQYPEAIEVFFSFHFFSFFVFFIFIIIIICLSSFLFLIFFFFLQNRMYFGMKMAVYLLLF